MGESVLSIKELTKYYGEKAAVDNVSFDVERGRIIGLLGPNGAGKTTVIRIIMGILSATKGSVEYGINGTTSSLNKRMIGYLPEERGLYDDVKVLENLIYLGTLKGMRRKEAQERAMEWLERLELDDYANQKLEKLSKGMQQKVQFIGSILHKPALLVLDEPFSGLDPVNQDVFKEIIRELCNEGITILLSAHQLNVVEELCEVIFMIHNGKQVLFGDLEEIKNKYDEYIVNIRYPEGQDISHIRNIRGSEIVIDNPGRIYFRYSGTDTTSDLLGRLSSKMKIDEIRIEKPPLHDIFVNIVKKRGEHIEESELS